MDVEAPEGEGHSDGGAGYRGGRLEDHRERELAGLVCVEGGGCGV